MSDVNELLIAPLQKFSKDSMHLIKKCTKPDRKGKSFFYTELLMSQFGSGGELQARRYPHRHHMCPASLALWRHGLVCFHTTPDVFADSHSITRISPFLFSAASANTRRGSLYGGKLLGIGAIATPLKTREQMYC